MSEKELLRVEHLKKYYPLKKGFMSKAGGSVKAVDDISFSVNEGETFAVVLYISTPGTDKPLAIEFSADEFTSTVDLSDGQSYISPAGAKWENLEETQESNLCLKVYGDYQE